MISSLQSIVAGRLFGVNNAEKNITDVSAQLASGLQNARAGDDVAANAVATKLAGELSALQQGQQNLLRDNTALQIADRSASQIQSALNRMQELSVQANNGTLGNTEREFLNTEFQALRSEISRIAQEPQTFITNVGNDTPLQTELPDLSAEALFGEGDLNLLSQESAQTASGLLAEGSNLVTQARADIGSALGQYDVELESIANQVRDITAARAELADTDVAQSSTELALAIVRGKAEIATQVQSKNLAPAILNLLN